MAKFKVIVKTYFENGLPVQKAWDMTTDPPTPFLIEEIPAIAKPCHDCGCSDSGGGGNVNIDDLPAYATSEAAQTDPLLNVGDLWKAADPNFMGVAANTVYQKT